MNRMPSPLNRTTVLGRVKASLATLGGFAGLDSSCAPWFLKLWAMDKWIYVKTHSHASNPNESDYFYAVHVARARGAGLENPRKFL